MGLSCSTYDYDGDGWYYYSPDDYSTLDTKRSRKCCSCKKTLRPGDMVVRFDRYRGPLSDIEQDIAGDEIVLAPWWMCEPCGDQFFNLDALGFCIMLGDESMDELRRQYVEEYVKRQNATSDA